MDKKTPEQVAKEKMDEINQKKEQEKAAQVEQEKEKAEPKGAAAAPSAEKAKTEENADIVKQAEEKAKNDARILQAKEEELSDEDKARKLELKKIEDEKKVKETPEEKLKRLQDSTQKRIDELVGELKAEKESRNKDAERTKTIENELASLKDELKKSKEIAAKPSEAEFFKKAEAERIKKYAEEDKDKPREERREMSKEELEEWILEDLTEAQDWLIGRKLRRERENNEFRKKTKIDKDVENILSKQAESAKRINSKHPELELGQKRIEELKTQGKSNEEIYKIVSGENPKWKLAQEILKENPDKYLFAEDGPELIAAEVERRLASIPKEKPKDEAPQETELEKLRRENTEKEAEIARLKGIDEGISSSAAGKPKTPVVKSELDKKQEELAQRAGISPERLQALKDRRNKIPGAGAYVEQE